MDCDWVRHLEDNGAAAQCPNNDCGPQVLRDDKGAPIGWRLFMGGGYWASDGSDSLLAFSDEVEFRDPSDPESWAMYLQGKGKSEKKGGNKRRKPDPVIAKWGVFNFNKSAPRHTSTNDGLTDLNSAYTVCGMASVAEYAFEHNGNWLGWSQRGLRMYGPSFHGSQYVSRSLAADTAKAFRALGRTTFYISAAISGYQGYQAVLDGKYASAGKSTLDIGMGALGTFGGPKGAIISTGYFVVDQTIGWDTVAEIEKRDPATRRLVNGKGLCIPVALK